MQKKNLQNRLLFVAAVPCLVFLAISVFYIFFFHVSPLSRDQWHMYFPYFNEGLLNAALYPQSNHRHIIPYFIFHIDMEWFEGNNHFLVAFGFFFDLLIIAFLCHALWLQERLSLFTKTTITFFIAIELLWLLNIAQLGWGFMSTMYYFAIFFYLLAIYMAWKALSIDVNSLDKKHLFFAALFGVLCTFSFGIGILVWPAMLVIAFYMRAPFRFYIFVSGLLLACLIVFFVLPGGKSVSAALGFNFMATLTFPFKLAGGPVYFVFKSFRCFDPAFLKNFSITLGAVAMFAGVLLLLEPLLRKRQFSAFEILCYALMLLGISTPMLITFSRIEMFLDPFVDRYQIWVTMFWLGFIPLCFLSVKWKPVFYGLRVMVLVLPFLLLPSQLDLGARLAEYKMRVDNALLSYQMYIPVRQDAIDALHWNWEYKLPYFFDVLEHLREQDKNIFNDRLDEWVGAMATLAQQLPACDILFNEKKQVKKNQLLNVADYYADTSNRWMLPGKGMAEMQLKANVASPANWDTGLWLDDNNRVVGLAHFVWQPPLPRGHFDFVGKRYNFYGVINLSNQLAGDGVKLLLLEQGRQRCLYQLKLD